VNAVPDPQARSDAGGGSAAGAGEQARSHPEFEPIDHSYYEQPAGSPAHRAAYEAYLTAHAGIGFPDPDDVDLSYEIDNAYELAADRYQVAMESEEPHHEPDPWPCTCSACREPEAEF
jgi:hypothetical protein